MVKNRSADKNTADPAAQKAEWLAGIIESRELLLGNLALLSEYPAQTFYEKNRAEFILSRYAGVADVDPTTDRVHNAIGIIAGRTGKRNLLICTHMDNQFNLSIDQSITVSADRVQGAGVADDNLGIAALTTLPDIFNKLGLRFNSNIILLGTTRYHGRGDFEGIRTFLKEYPEKIDAVINIIGLSLGSLDYFSLSRVRCDIHCELQEPELESSWGRMSECNAILVANEVINSLYSIPLPKKPKTILNIGMISGGERYSTVSRDAHLNLEILSDDNTIMDHLCEQIIDNCTDIAAKNGANITCDFFGRHKASGLSSSHPLIKCALETIRSLGYKPRTEYSNSQIAVCLARGIPSISIGLTEGLGGSSNRSFIELDPLEQGLLQLIMLIYQIDKMGNLSNE
ncbi:MAG: M20/M25/M40 family metallo-hydrolase [Victivallaceae bacterium]|nr:M20/M25/M40 family metallo-hydrolase [Victivallaceae bacterium]